MSGTQDVYNVVGLDNLEPKIQELLRKAAEVRKVAYAPYSKFLVGSAVLGDDKSTIFSGCNVENCTQQSVCAERTAYVKAVSEGTRKFRAVAVVADLSNGELTFPCGTCRQFLSEFGNVDIYVATPNLDKIVVTSLYKILPCHFSLNVN